MLIKCLTATRKTQGARKNDFFWATPGETCYLPIVRCDGEKPDDVCGCARAVSGVTSAKATTTAQVSLKEGRELIDEYAAFLVESWGLKPRAARTQAAFAVNDMAQSLAQFQPGDVVELRGDEFVKREG